MRLSWISINFFLKCLLGENFQYLNTKKLSLEVHLRKLLFQTKFASLRALINPNKIIINSNKYQKKDREPPCESRLDSLISKREYKETCREDQKLLPLFHLSCQIEKQIVSVSVPHFYFSLFWERRLSSNLETDDKDKVFCSARFVL